MAGVCNSIYEQVKTAAADFSCWRKGDIGLAVDFISLYIYLFLNIKNTIENFSMLCILNKSDMYRQSL